MFNDADMQNEVDEDDVTKIGEPLYFKLSQEFPVTGVVFAIDGKFHKLSHYLRDFLESLFSAKLNLVMIDKFFKIFLDCVVKDANSDQEYSVIENQCTDVFVNTEMSPAFSSDAVNFSYTAFQFVANSDVTEALSMRLVCSVRPIFMQGP